MKLFYRTYGSGPVLIILHGLFGSSDNWVSIARKLSDQFTVILPDQRNHGSSPHSDEHNYDLMRDDLYQLVTELSPGKFFLAGHSMGGKTAIAFAIRWPEMLNGLLVADISPFKGDDPEGAEYKQHQRILQAMMTLNLKEIASRADAEAELEKTGLPEHVRGFILKNLQRSSENSFEWKLNPVALKNNLWNIMKPVSREDAFKYTVTGFPVIFIKGEKSDYLPVSDYGDIRRIFPAAEFIEIKGAGHWVHADNPVEVITSIRMLNQ